MCGGAYCSPRIIFTVRAVYASVGIVFGLMICVVFNVAFPNKGAAYLGLCSSVFASLALAGYIYVYVRTERQRQQPHLPAIVVFAVIGAVGISVGVGTVVIFLGLGIVDSVNHVDLPLTHTHYIASVWAFATFKWGLIVFIHALRTFRKMVRNQFSPLQQEARDDGAALITGEEATSGTINS